MLFAVEGGGFFSASASGYSKGLTFLLLGQKNDEKPMRVSPWNQYQLVDQESDPDLQLASAKDRLVRGCASFVCFGRAAAGLESPSPLKVGPTQQHDFVLAAPIPDKGKDHIHIPEVVEDDNSALKVSLKDSLKKPTNGISVSAGGGGNECERLSKKGSDIPGHTERRNVQWTDASGGELVEIREFEPRTYPRRRRLALVERRMVSIFCCRVMELLGTHYYQLLTIPRERVFLERHGCGTRDWDIPPFIYFVFYSPL